MGRIVQLRPDTIIVGNAEAIVEIAQTEVQNVALEVALLVRKLNDSVSITTRDGPKITLRLLKKPEMATRVRVSRGTQQQISFDIPLNLLEYLEVVLLRAYRDGLAEVNHIHLEGEFNDDAFDLTVMFDTSRPPLSPEEVERFTRK